MAALEGLLQQLMSNKPDTATPAAVIPSANQSPPPGSGPAGKPSHASSPSDLQALSSSLHKSSSMKTALSEPKPVAILSNIVLKDWETPLPGTHRHMDEVETMADGLLPSAAVVAVVKESHGVEGKLVVRYYHPDWMAWGRLPEGKVRPARKETGELWLEVRAQVQDLPPPSPAPGQVSPPDRKNEVEADPLEAPPSELRPHSQPAAPPPHTPEPPGVPPPVVLFPSGTSCPDVPSPEALAPQPEAARVDCVEQSRGVGGSEADTPSPDGPEMDGRTAEWQAEERAGEGEVPGSLASTGPTPSLAPAVVPMAAALGAGTRPDAASPEFENFAGMESSGGIDLPWLVVEWHHSTTIAPTERKEERTLMGRGPFLATYLRLYPEAHDWLQNQQEQPANEKLFGVERNVMITPDKLATRLPGLPGYLAPDNGLDRFVLFIAGSRDSFTSKGATRVNGRWKPRTSEWCSSPDCPALAFLDHKWTDEPGLDWNASWNCYLHLITEQSQRGGPSCDCLAAIRFVRTPRRSPGGARGLAPAPPRAAPAEVDPGSSASGSGLGMLSETLTAAKVGGAANPGSGEKISSPARELASEMEPSSGYLSDAASDASGPRADSVSASASASASGRSLGSAPVSASASGRSLGGSMRSYGDSAAGSFAERRSLSGVDIADVEIPRLPNGQVDWEHPTTQAVLGEILATLAAGEKAVAVGAGENLGALLAAVDKLPPLVRFLSSLPEQKTCEGLLRHLQAVLADGLQILHTEFVHLLESSSAPPKGPLNLRDDLERQIEHMRSGRPDAPARLVLPEMPGEEAVQVLHALVCRLVMPEWKPRNGISFKDRRREALTRNLQRLGVEPLKAEGVGQMPWEELEARMKAWGEHMRAAIRILFQGERQLCDQVLAGLDPFPDRCFCESAGGCLLWLLDLGSLLATGKKTPEKLVALLDMHHAVADLQPLVGELFRGPPGARYRQAMGALLERLGSVAKETAQGFERIVEQEAAVSEAEGKARGKKTERRSGSFSVEAELAKEVAVQGLTSYVVNYMRLLASRNKHYVATLTAIYGESPLPVEADSSFLQSGGGLGGLFQRIMQSLDHNLLAKAKQQRDVHLQEVFLLNNVWYIIQNIGSCDAAELLGSDWMAKHQKEVETRREFYIGLLLAKMDGQVFQPEPGDSKAVASRLKIFNAEFDALRHNKSYQFLIDGPVQTSVCSEILRRVSAGYRKFIESHKTIIASHKSVSKLYIYTPGDVEMKLRQAFISPA